MSIRVLFLCVLLLYPALFAQAAPAESPAILVMGDSLSAAYGVPVEQGWVALLQGRLKAEGYGYRVVNASASGETTGGALARLPRALERHRPAVVILELGANDGLRGLPIDDVRRNFDSLIKLSRAADAKVLLIGMRIPPNYGPAYTGSFAKLYGQLADQYRLPLVPFFLDGIALDDSLMQDDGLHPNATAQPKLLALVWPRLEPLLAQVKSTNAAGVSSNLR